MLRLLRSPLLHFLAIGLLLFVGRAVLDRALDRSSAMPIVEVPRSEIEERLEAYRRQMGRAPDARESEAIERQAIENAIWLLLAFELGLHEIDSVVRQRLILNMRFLEGESEADDETLVARAIELGMDRSDTVVKRRLVDRVQAIIRASVRARPVADDTIAAYYAEHREKWREPPLLDLTHVYLSRDRRGPKTIDDARALLERLAADQTDPEAAIALGDPFLAGHRLRGASPRRIVARLGPEFADGVAEAPTGRWIGPVASAFGQHLVWIHERIASRVPPLEDVRSKVVEDWIDQQTRQALREHIERRRAAVEVRIVDEAAATG